jgi:hypothetical protein
VREDVVENARDFLSSEEEQPGVLDILQRRAMQPSRGGSSSLRRYQVNVLVDHSKSEGAPVVYEDNPTFQNLIGRLDEIEIPVLLVR